ncbi:MAG: gamma-glutamylcyclotransferase family protein [Pseudomonadota bacterium]
MPQVPARYVFVYGTLRRGDDNDINLRQPLPVFVGEARVAGTLYHLGGYPGLVLGGNGWVVGEVYAITEALERDLDALEAVYPQQTDEYAKREIAVSVAGRSLNCLVYEINPHYIAHAPPIACGDWVKGRRG